MNPPSQAQPWASAGHHLGAPVLAREHPLLHEHDGQPEQVHHQAQAGVVAAASRYLPPEMVAAYDQISTDRSARRRRTRSTTSGPSHTNATSHSGPISQLSRNLWKIDRPT